MEKEILSEEVVKEQNYVEELLELIRSGMPAESLAEEIDNYHDNDIADALDELDQRERRKLYQVLGVERVSEIFAYLDDVGKYLDELEPERAAGLPRSGRRWQRRRGCRKHIPSCQDRAFRPRR